MGRAQQQLRRQGELLALMEPGATLPTATRAATVPLLAALLLEVTETEAGTSGGSATSKGGCDEQDRV